MHGEQLSRMYEAVEPARRAQDILKLIQLKPEELAGKQILDLGSGPERVLATTLAAQGSTARITSLDLTIPEQDRGANAVSADFFDGLPFDEQTFDLIINVGGPMMGGPWNTVVHEWYAETIHTLKPHGELRSYNALFGIGGLPFLTYNLVKRGELDSTLEPADKFFTDEDVEEVEFDDDGLPLPFPPGDLYWTDLFDWQLPPDEQERLTTWAAEKLEEELRKNGLAVTISVLPQPSDEPRAYNHCLIVRRNK